MIETYYQHYKIRPLLRGWRKIGEQISCPLCKRIHGLVSVGFMNHTYMNKLIEHQRCEYCLLKLPVSNRVVMKLLGLNKKALPTGQMTL